MDPTIPVLAATVASTLGPAIPYLAGAGEFARSESGQKTIGALWDLFWPKAETTPALADAIKDVEVNPNDEDSLTVLRVQIRKALEADPDLVAQTRPIVENASTSVSQSVVGNRNITAGRDISGSQITFNERA
jgi:hypothetical protein